MGRIGWTAGAGSLAVAAWLAAGPAWAVDAQGLYLGGGAGLIFNRDSNLNIPNVGSPSVDFKTGFTAIGTIGYAFPGGLRAELEGGYRNLKWSAPPPAVQISRRMTSFTGMANLLYDFDTESAITPYIGGGVGIAVIDSGKTRSHFAYQGIAGVAYAINDKLDAYVDYRYIGTDKVKYANAEVENRSHNVLAGLRYSFGQATGDIEPVAAPAAPRGPTPVYVPPPAAPAPAPVAPAAAMPQSYLVFFNFAQTGLDAEAQRIVRTAAMNARDAAVTRIDVTGHADTVGGQGANQDISRRRAQVVKQELVKNGVRARDIVIYAKGETQQLVPTPDNVRERQNRRVEIVLN